MQCQDKIKDLKYNQTMAIKIRREKVLKDKKILEISN